MRTWTLTFDWARPPLSMNDRLHYTAKARITARIREVVAAHARTAGIPPLEHCTVILRWTVTDRRVRDVENPTPTYKAACDALVDAGVVPDDRPELMSKHMPRIVYVPRADGGVAHIELDVTEGHA